MKIVLTTFGSRGDVQPMLTLSLALKSAGHDVLLAAPPEKGEWARQLGCPFHPLGGNFTAFIDSMENAHSIHTGLRFVRRVRYEILGQFKTLSQIISGADLVLASSLVFALSSIAESMGIRYRYIAFAPQLLPSGHHPFIALKHQNLPKWCNVMSWQIVKIFDRFFNLTRLINKKREQLGLPLLKDVWSHILGDNVIVASDQAIAPVPPDVGRGFTQTGYLHLEQPKQHLADLEAFLSHGPPPVYAGFGSMPKKDQVKNVPIIVRAARLAGQRVVIAKFWEGPSEFIGSSDVFFVQKYPHLDLFPRMAAVIHHGGAGTTAAGAISGVPQIIVPHVLDQYYWGNRVYRVGLGPKPIWRSRLSSRKLAAAIEECTKNHWIVQRAAAVARMIKGKDSLAMTVREVLRDPGRL